MRSSAPMRGILIAAIQSWAKAPVLRLPARSGRPAAVCLLALCLLTPVWQELASLSTRGSPCGMSCCKSGTSCSCCRRSRREENRQGAQWNAEARCCGDCAQPSVLPAWPGLNSPQAFVLLLPSVSATRLLRESHAGWIAASAEFALFQRPPPTLLQLQVPLVQSRGGGIWWSHDS